jgi:biopolymer transport protein ExbD
MELQIAPLIDVVFLLLIYFIMAAQLIKKEGDINFVLPADVPSASQINMPVETLIEIEADGLVRTDGLEFAPGDELLDGLANHLRGLKAMAESQESPFFVNLVPSQDAIQRRIVNVMDACAAAEVKNLTFSESF